MNTQQTTDTFQLVTRSERLLADTVTPVSIYLKIRDRYENPILLESSDYHSSDNSFSYICCQPIASFSVSQRKVTQVLPDGNKDEFVVENPQEIIGMLTEFASRFQSEEHDYRFTTNGLFGYMAYDAVQYFEDIDLSSDEKSQYNIPE
ncbi:MAG: anthranilate synthase component I family protein, partial [Bacteroidota bacterium]